MTRIHDRDRLARSAFAVLVLLVLGMAGVVGQRQPRTRKPAALSESAMLTSGILSASAAPTLPPAEKLEPPHPITSERAGLQRELQLIGALNDAMDLRDVTTMRRLIERYREHEPDDANRMRAGYEIIADCLQYPGAASRERARAYYDGERASTLRRYVRRACFE